jgi:hypothetical protein
MLAMLMKTGSRLGGLVAVVSAWVFLSAGPALALTETPDPGMSTTSGKILAMAQLGNTMYMGGHFLSVKTPGSGTQEVQNLAAFDATTGRLIPGWSASVTNTNSSIKAKVEELAISEDEDWLYVGGNFDTVNG